MNNNDDLLYDWFFWKNYHEDLWYAIHRDTLLFFMSGRREESLYYKSKDFETLESLLRNPEKLKKLINDNG